MAKTEMYPRNYGNNRKNKRREKNGIGGFFKNFIIQKIPI